jgi:hypothetical protein
MLSLVSGGFPVAHAVADIQYEYQSSVNPDICHADKNDYSEGKQNVDAHSILNSNSGHDGHDTKGLDDKGDIIPSFPYEYRVKNSDDPWTPAVYPGKNLTTLYSNGYTGAQILENECDTPVEEILGCTDSDATNYNEEATQDDGSCLFPLTITKIISGTTNKTAADFSFQIDGGSPIAFESDGTNVIEKSNGTYDITEVAVPGFTTTYQGCDNLVINGMRATCTILNTVVTLPPGDVCPNIPGDQSTIPDGFVLNEAGECVNYGCMDQDATNYDQFATVDDNSCTYTLTVKKLFAGNYDVAYSAFAFEVNDGASTAFDGDGVNELVLQGGEYTVNETPKANYTPAYDLCSDIVLDGPKTCTITNTYVTDTIPGCMDQDANNYNSSANTQASCTYDLTVKKVVVGSDAPADDFSFIVDNGAPEAFDVIGENVVSVSEGAHAVTEVDAEGFTTTYDAGCTITDMNSPVTCTITNTAQVDVCLNIDGYQTEVPEGYTWTDNNICIQTFVISGYKWNDRDGDGEWDKDGDDVELGIPLWTIYATDGSQNLTTQTDGTGYYSFEVEAGNWTVSEKEESGWIQTAPDLETTDGVCSAPLGLEYPFPVHEDVPIVSTDAPVDNLECIFGNQEDDDDDDDSDPELACSISASDSSIDEDDDVTIYWDTTLADSVTLNGETVNELDGSKLFENLQSDTTYILVASNSETEDSVECTVTVEVDEDNGGGSSSGSKKRKSTSSADPIGEVLGESTNVLPVGAPNTGAGGATQSPMTSIVALFGMLMSLVTMRMTRNVQ